MLQSWGPHCHVSGESIHCCRTNCVIKPSDSQHTSTSCPGGLYLHLPGPLRSSPQPQSPSMWHLPRAPLCPALTAVAPSSESGRACPPAIHDLHGIGIVGHWSAALPPFEPKKVPSRTLRLWGHSTIDVLCSFGQVLVTKGGLDSAIIAAAAQAAADCFD